MHKKKKKTFLMKRELLLHPHLPRSLSLRGPYLSMTMPRGRVMADSRKEPTVKARFSISSWSLQIGQSVSDWDELEMLKLEPFSTRKEQEKNFFLYIRIYIFFILTFTSQLLLKQPKHTHTHAHTLPAVC